MKKKIAKNGQDQVEKCGRDGYHELVLIEEADVSATFSRKT